MNQNEKIKQLRELLREAMGRQDDLLRKYGETDEMGEVYSRDIEALLLIGWIDPDRAMEDDADDQA